MRLWAPFSKSEPSTPRNTADAHLTNSYRKLNVRKLSLNVVWLLSNINGALVNESSWLYLSFGFQNIHF